MTVQSYSIDYTSSSTDKTFYHVGDNISNPFDFTPKYLTLDIISSSNTCVSTLTPFSLGVSYERSSAGTYTFLTPYYKRDCSSSYIYDISGVLLYSDLLYISFRSNAVFQNGFTYGITLFDDFPYDSSPVSGNLDITSNGIYDVSSYATATVDVPQTSINPYHDDLVGIKSAILIGCATLLVIYFFYCIYRMIIRGSSVN